MAPNKPELDADRIQRVHVADAKRLFGPMIVGLKLLSVGARSSWLHMACHMTLRSATHVQPKALTLSKARAAHSRHRCVS